jgi:nifR3 family TIM-barrel protein
MVPPLRLGSVAISLPAVQAALSGYSDLAMRLVAREHGAPYALNEVVLDTIVLTPGKLRRRVLSVPPADHPVGGQLMGTDPATFAAAAKDLVAGGYDVVDINFGCPVNKVLGRCRGGWLLTEPDAALAIVDAVLAAVGGAVPVTVKMRRGYDESLASTAAFYRILEGAFGAGVAAATVHPRTVVQKYVGPSRWPFLAEVKRHFGDRTILGSGDLFTASDVVRMLAATGVDGASIARGCIGNPFVFAQVRDLLAGRPAAVPTCAQQQAALLRHWQLAVEHLGSESKALPIVRMHAIKYGQHHPDPVWARDQFVAVRTPAAFVPTVKAVFDGERAALRSTR